MFDLKELLKAGPLILDGATGTCLQKMGMPAGVCPELWMLEHKETVTGLTRAYMEAGSRIVLAPTFSGNRIKLKEYGADDRVEEINKTLVQWTREAVGRNDSDTEVPCYVAADMTMTGQSLAPVGSLDFEALVECYKEQAGILAAAGADLFIIETMMHIGETRAAVLAVKEETDLPVFVTMTFEANGRTLYGTDPVTALVTLQAMGVDAFGINCSCGPDLLLPWIKEMSRYAKIPLIAKPNAGLPKLVDGQTVFDMDKETFVARMETLVDHGVAIAGGCCGTTPEYIRLLSERMAGKNGAWHKLYAKIYAGPEESCRRVLTSERRFVPLCLDGQFTVIGERINPTGKKALQAELREGVTDLAVEMAENQVSLGASVLDINVGMGGIDEKAVMLKVLGDVSGVTDAPLCIDSGSVAVIEAALRRYHGRALVNSVSCEKVKIERLLPVVKKYGAMFILLPLTDEGLPENLEERKKNIQTVMAAARKLGFEKTDVVVDGLTGSAGALKSAGMDTLETIAYAKANGLATVCGLSNISFGLPDRGYVNGIFLALAISRGLTMAIANPSQELLMRSGFAADLLLGKDEADIRYIEASQRYKAAAEEKKVKEEKKAAEEAVSRKREQQTADVPEGILAVIHGDVLKGKARGVVSHLQEALEQGVDASVILNKALIPAINLVGQYFSEQKYFLPQLILSAEAMRRGVDALEPELLKKNAGKQGPTVVIATVKGDVHDIGKNLVAMMMKNYGFNVIDLGKDVDKETIILAAKEHHAKIIALSALMTTTMQYMKEVIAWAAKTQTEAKIIVGGAAVTESYAKEIGADGYSEDAVGAVKLVQRLLEL